MKHCATAMLLAAMALPSPAQNVYGPSSHVPGLEYPFEAPPRVEGWSHYPHHSDWHRRGQWGQHPRAAVRSGRVGPPGPAGYRPAPLDLDSGVGGFIGGNR